MQKNAFITGNSTGLGKGLSEVLLSRGYSVYGCSRRGCGLQGSIKDGVIDLTDFDSVPSALEQLLQDVSALQLVVLNAGMLGRLQDIREASLDELKQLMDINVWANKVVLDWLLASGIRVEQILLISSGAAVLGNKGWAGYALSKAALNMLAKLYAHEFPETHISAVAPGLIDSTMIDYLCHDADSEKFPALKRIHKAREENKILSPVAAAERILEALSRLKDLESGSFIDLRQILAPEEYHELMRARTAVENNSSGH
ncbi:SDR family NAD(P)-dependent oxidoreductase [Methylomarinum sp. Ch1-1]|uniref:SDR family NAD(P)-dependent oxidoreductase n=1 Tax=Methylomarinum roseum TaxID=3067653 RepID=A0AAU7NR43_9GAMM|nr:SDR family NAD(P)-dependent oxidoreductase [Methylomarinum sp. Ch1-1]MDP4520554.1 SDR family NAD(P)-dependent oxidoreductase [Methylomarinum sp. Ch1-1]